MLTEDYDHVSLEDGADKENEKANHAERKSTSSVSCKICFDSGKDEDPITPCLCKGSIGCVHLSCLEKWLGMTNSNSCELCGYRFDLTREPRYPVVYSVYVWLFKETDDSNQNRHALVDIILFLLIAPVFFGLMFACVAFASVSEMPVGKNGKTRGFWPPLILTLAASVIGLALYLWSSLVLSTHSRTWYKWWQSKNVVRIHNINGQGLEPPRLRTTLMETAFV